MLLDAASGWPAAAPGRVPALRARRARGRPSTRPCAAASPRWSRREGCRRANQGLAHGVVHGDAGARRGVPREECPRAPPRPDWETRCAAPRRSARRRAARTARPPGWRTACRATPCRGPGRSSRSRPAPASAARPSPPGRPQPARAARGGASGTPLGVRWKGELGAGQRGGQRRDRLPGRTRDRLAVSITRPPPRATTGSPVARPSRAADSTSTRPGAREAPAPHVRGVPAPRPVRARWSAG